MVIGKYADYPKEYTQIAKIETFPTKGKTYTEAEFTGLGNMRAMAEGEAISFDVPEEGHKKSIQAVKYGLGFQRTEEMDADELFGMMKSVPQSLSRSAAACLETNFWNLFNPFQICRNGRDRDPYPDKNGSDPGRYQGGF